MIDPVYQGEIGLLLHNEDKEDYICHAGYSLGHLLVLLCHIIKANEKLKLPSPGRMTNGSET